MSRFAIRFIAALLAAATPTLASACPRVGKFIDINCDGRYKIVVTGDSIVRGIGDLKNRNNGGYVKRLAKAFRRAQVINLGKPGYSSDRLLAFLTGKLRSRANKIKNSLQAADLVVVAVGTNDFFSEQPAGATIGNIERIVQLLRSELAGPDYPAPFVVVATLTPTRRGFQRPFVNEVNTLLLKQFGVTLPLEVRFDTISPSLISIDGIHPTSQGYTILAKIAQRYISRTVQDLASRTVNDSDGDGVYDSFEINRFGTDPRKRDTDGDGLSDGEELFKYFTDPKRRDSDGDGIDDGDEVRNGTDPTEANRRGPTPTPEPTVTPEPTP